MFKHRARIPANSDPVDYEARHVRELSVEEHEARELHESTYKMFCELRDLDATDPDSAVAYELFAPTSMWTPMERNTL